MFDTMEKCRVKISRKEFHDRVLGCWTGKNIGGTLGAPFEGGREMNEACFYTQDLKGKPTPNDDLDLQLVWLSALERFGAYTLDERALGEYWLDRITAAWNEYGVCLYNLRNGLIPPLSGACNNDRWKYSNGAWIRSEIWACLFPGSPDEAAQMAYYDACCDHCGDGIYAEVFTATLESAAFLIRDVRELVRIGLSRIPAGSRIARSVKLACDCYDKKVPFREARGKIVADNADLGFFQAPGNLGFMMLGLLYGEGDFGKTVSLATNCGDDTDCTAGTAGAILGIMLGRSGIPRKWTDPIGESIQTGSIDSYIGHHIPRDLDELTQRVIRQAETAAFLNPAVPQFTDGEPVLPPEYIPSWEKSVPAVEVRVWKRDPYEFAYDLPFGRFFCSYAEGPYFRPGEQLKISLGFSTLLADAQAVSLKLNLPAGWKALPSPECVLNAKCNFLSRAELTVIPAEAQTKFVHVPVSVRIADRLSEFSLTLPFQNGGPDAAAAECFPFCRDWCDAWNRNSIR